MKTPILAQWLEEKGFKKYYNGPFHKTFYYCLNGITVYLSGGYINIADSKKRYAPVKSEHRAVAFLREITNYE